MVKCGNLFITYKGLRKNDELKITIFRAFSIIFDSERAFVSSDQAIQIYINIISTKTKLHLLMILFIIINGNIPLYWKVLFLFKPKIISILPVA